MIFDMSQPVVLQRRGYVYEISAHDQTVVTAHGSNDGYQTSTTRVLATAHEAQVCALTMIQAKIGEGYKVNGAGGKTYRSPRTRLSERRQVRCPVSCPSHHSQRNSDNQYPFPSISRPNYPYLFSQTPKHLHRKGACESRLEALDRQLQGTDMFDFGPMTGGFVEMELSSARTMWGMTIAV